MRRQQPGYASLDSLSIERATIPVRTHHDCRGCRLTRRSGTGEALRLRRHGSSLEGQYINDQEISSQIEPRLTQGQVSHPPVSVRL